MSEQSWRDAYALRKKVVQMEGDAARASTSASDIASKSFQKAIEQTSPALSSPKLSDSQLKQPNYVAPEDQQKQLQDDAYRDQIEKGGFEGFMGSVGKALDKPFIKQALNAITTGTYISANIANNFVAETSKEKALKRVQDNKGDTTKAALESIGSILSAPIRGVGQGLSAGIGQNPNDANTFGTVIKEVQRQNGIEADPNEDGGGAAGAVQGWGGLAGDILLDPLTYATFGAVPLIKGAAKGAVQGSKRAKDIAAKAVEDANLKGVAVPTQAAKIAENTSGRIATSARESRTAYRDWKATRADEYRGKQVIKALKKGDAESAKGLSVGYKGIIAGQDEKVANLLKELSERELSDAVSDGAFNVPKTIDTVTESPIEELAKALDVPPETIAKIAEEPEVISTPTEKAAEAIATITDKPAESPFARIAAINEQLTKPRYNTAKQREALTPKQMSTEQIPTGKFEEYEVTPAKARLSAKVNPPEPKPEVIFGERVNADNLDKYIDFDKLYDTIVASPGMILKKVVTRKNPVTGEAMETVKNGTAKEFNKFLDDEATGINVGAARAGIDSYLATNAGLLSSHAIDVSHMAKAAQLSKPVEKVLQEASPAVMGRRQIMADGEIIEKAPYTPSMAEELKINRAHANLPPEEIAKLTSAMTDREITKFITNTANTPFIKEIQAITGLDTLNKAELSKAFLALRKEFLTSLKSRPKTKVTRESRAEQVLGDAANNAEALAKIQADAAETAKVIADSPVALSESVQLGNRITDLEKAIADAKTDIPTTGLVTPISGDDIVDIGHRAVQAAMQRQLKEGPFRTGNLGNHTLTENPKTGESWHPARWSTNSQLALHTSIMSEVSQLTNFALTKRRLYMKALAVADKELRAAGIEPYLTHVNASGGKVNLSLFDVLKGIEEGGGGGALQNHLFTADALGFRPTEFQGAAEMLMHMRAQGKPETDIFKALVDNFTKKQGHVGRPERNELSDLDIARKAKSIRTGAKSGLKNPKATDAEVDSFIMSNAEKITQAIMSPGVYEAYQMRSLINHTMHNSVIGKRIDDLSEDTVERLYTIRDTGTPGEALELFKKAEGNLSKAFNKEEIDAARAGFASKLADVISNVERKVIKTAEVRVKASDPKPNLIADALDKQLKAKVATPVGAKPKVTKLEPAVTKKLEQVQAVVDKTAVSDAKAVTEEVLEAAPVPKPADPVTGAPEVFAPEAFDMIGAQIATDMMKKIHPIQKLVNPRLGLDADTYRAINSGLHSIARQQNAFHSTLLDQVAKRGHAELTADFTTIQRLSAEHLAKGTGDAFKLPDDIAESAREMYEIMSVLFDTSLSNVYARNGIGAKHFNAHLNAANLNKDWRFDIGASKDVNAHAWTQWEGIEKAGVLDFMSKMHTATVKASQDIAIAASFSKNFGTATYKPGEGLVKITHSGNRAKGDSGLYDLIDTTLYYPKEIAAQLHQIDNLLTETRSLNASKPIGKFFVNVFDPVTNALKASQTTVRPGHWAISFAGDILRNQIAGVNSVVPYQHAVAIMRAGGLTSDDFIGDIASASSHRKAITAYEKDASRASGFDLEEAVPVAGKKRNGVTAIIGGKKVLISYKDMNTILQDGVAIPKHRGGGGALEDRFIGEAPVTSKLARGLEKGTDFVTDNKRFSLNEWAAKRDNLMRISLAVDMASKRTWKSVDEMKAAMEEHVTKWAPLSTDFTAFEAKYMRRTLMYYTWLRGITPRIIDSAMTKPGVVTMIPKAQYNIALANGLHPESIGNPFDSEEMYADYHYKNILGPQWRDEYGEWGINPSSPVVEVANTFSGLNPMHPVDSMASIGKMLMGMSTPFTKLPAEMALGTQLQSGVPIESRTQYAIDSLGGSWAGALSRGTGKTIGEGGIVDRTDSARKEGTGEQFQHGMLQLINFMSGAKLTDYQSDGALNSAIYSLGEEIDKRAERNSR